MNLRSAALTGLRGRPFSALARTAALLGVLVLTACAGGDDAFVVEAAPPAADLYAEGMAAYEANRLGDAVEVFGELDRRYPYSEQGKRALILLAEAEYSRGNYEEAIAAGERYMTLYGTSPDAAQALQVITESWLRQVPDITRDQDAARQALTAAEELVERFPTSQYADQARLNIIAINDQLAGAEMQVGRYYQERREYIAAINRFRLVVEEYDTTRHVEEALFRMTETYLAMGLTSEAQTAAATLGHNFPNSPWYERAYRLLNGG